MIRLRPQMEAFIAEFYDAFTARSPDILEKFKDTDMVHQRKMIHHSFKYMCDFFARKETSTFMDDLAVKHNRTHMNIHPEWYDYWLDALVLAVEKFDPAFSRDVELSWRIVMAPGIAFMQFNY